MYYFNYVIMLHIVTNKSVESIITELAIKLMQMNNQLNDIGNNHPKDGLFLVCLNA